MMENGKIDHIRISFSAYDVDVINVYQKALSFRDIDAHYDHGLCVLNSWRSAQHTFTHLGKRTRIDYICTRLMHANGPSKLASPHHACTLTAWKDTRHFPVLAWISCRKSHIKSAEAKQPIYDRHGMTLGLQDPKQVEAANQKLTSIIGNPSANYADIPQAMHQVAAHLYPKTRGQCPALKTAGWRDSGIQLSIRTMWQAYKTSKGITTLPAWQITRQQKLRLPWQAFLLRRLVLRWRASAFYMTCRKQTQAHGRRIKRERFMGYLKLIDDAEKAGNPHAMYKVIRSLAPKMPRVRPAIRGEHGEFLTDAGEVKAVKAHFQSVWKLPAEWEHPELSEQVVASTSEDAFSFQVPTLTEIISKIDSIRTHKALPDDMPPAGIWKMVAPTLGCVAYAATCDYWNHIQSKAFPAQWSYTQVVLLPKPGKMHGQPSSLRPIGLQDPIAKSYVSILASKLQPYAKRYLRDIPQFAYLSHRDAIGAQYRALRHCRLAREHTQLQVTNVHHRREHGQTRKFAAALQISIDLTQAFDCAPWQLLRESLHRTV
ncbi:unnamed protein product [Symbiodinium natans]|uniref:Reverse transcriptase domain-containing protein n=1 Tax=Symbiodinium natans TaxID=878477 RepID=A0A812URA6_9DINO|nr:unnamed protein product [Symbiodinium natans]